MKIHHRVKIFCCNLLSAHPVRQTKLIMKLLDLLGNHRFISKSYNQANQLRRCLKIIKWFLIRILAGKAKIQALQIFEKKRFILN